MLIVPREILLYFFPEYQVPSELGHTSLEELIGNSEVSWLFFFFFPKKKGGGSGGLGGLTEEPEFNLQ